MMTKRFPRLISLLICLCMLAPAAPVVALASSAASASAPQAYIGPSRFAYLPGAEEPLVREDVAYLVYQDADSLYYVKSTSMDAADALVKQPLSGGQPAVLSNDVYSKAVYVPMDDAIYYLSFKNLTSLMKLDLSTGRARMVQTVQPAGGQLSVTLAGLRYLVQTDTGYVNEIYSAQKSTWTPSTILPEDTYRAFDGFETQIDEFGALQLRLAGSGSWQIVTGGSTSNLAELNGLLYYGILVASETSAANEPTYIEIYAYNPATASSAYVAGLSGAFTDQMVTANGMLYLQTSTGEVIELNPATGLSRSVYQPEAALYLPSMASAGSLVVIYDGDVYVAEYPDQGATQAKTAGTYPELRRGAKGDAVVALQSRLSELGYPVGKVDGNFGANTLRAVRYFQDALGIDQDGIANSALQEALFGYGAPEFVDYVALQRGSSGIRVEETQTRLRTLGYMATASDGQYGADTERAVKLFQQEVGLRQTGAASPTMLQKLFSTKAPKCSVYIDLYKGNFGPRVDELKARLKALKYLKATGGSYDEKTAVAVRLFQETAGLTADGNANVKTLTRLFRSNAPGYYDFFELARGDRGERVKELQRRLKELGYYNGAITGGFNSATQTAVEAFQAVAGLDVTGIATVETQDALFANGAPINTNYTTLRPGDTGERVKALQRRLMELGYFNGSIGGNYLEKTTAAVKLFQQIAGLKVTGIATVATQQALYAADAPYNPGTPAPTPTPTPAPYKELRPGATGAAVKALQQRLLDLGYFDGAVGGNYLDKTTAAVKLFQQAAGLKVTGIATVATQQALFAADAPYNPNPLSPYTELKPGSSGDAVKALQQRLYDLGYFDGAVGGNYLDKTTAAVKLFQKAIGMKQDGVASVALQEALFADDAPYNPNPLSPYTALKPGDSGDAVKALQQRLYDLGYFDGAIGGNYLDKTTAAVKAFQKAIGVKQDGIASVALQEALFADDAPAKTASVAAQSAEAPADNSTPKPLDKPTPEPTPQPVAQVDILAELKGTTFTFTSGAGAWSTVITMGKNGAFTGTYSDSDMGDTGDDYPNGTQQLSNFSGTFVVDQKIDDYTYALKLNGLKVDGTIGEESIVDGVKVTTAAPYGLDGGKNFTLYLPGRSTADLEPAFLSWAPAGADVSTSLPFYGLYNVAGEFGFFAQP